MTSLKDQICQRIGLDGPMSVERYMDICIQHYYATRDPLGTRGDFVTSPEISQVFGELLGLWVLEIWHAMGRPACVNLVELGPGRGTLMADLLRAAKALPGFLTAAQVHLVETSPALREKQKSTLAPSGANIVWHSQLTDVPNGAMILVANEFFDALPIRQFMASEDLWYERLVGLDGGRLVFGRAPEPETGLDRPPPGAVFREAHLRSATLTCELAERLAGDGGAALIVDYGYWGPAFGDTLQAMAHHTFVDPLAEPGEADLTAHVDFAQIAHAAKAAGVALHGPGTQADFLNAMGLSERMAQLKRNATNAQAEALDQGAARLTASGPRGMGDLFKVLALTDPTLSSVPGLAPLPTRN